MTREVNYLFAGDLIFGTKNGECLGQNCLCYQAPEGAFNVGDIVEYGGKTHKIATLELVPPENYPDLFLSTYRVNVENV